MKCVDIGSFLDPFLDGEFGEREALEVELHLDECGECAEKVEGARALREAVRTSCSQRAPLGLRESILDAIDNVTEVPGGADELSEPQETTRPMADPAMQAMLYRERGAMYAAGLTLAAGLVIFGVWLSPLLKPQTGTLASAVLPEGAHAAAAASSADQLIVRQSLDWHRRSLPLEVVGAKHRTIENWFVGKVDFPVRIPNIHRPGAALLGARLANVGAQRAALFTHQVDQRELSVMMFPTAPADGSLSAQRIADPRRSLRDRREPIRTKYLADSGYNVALVEKGSMTYAFVSEVSRERLKEIVSTTTIP